MKFPLACDAFPPVALAAEEREALQTLAERELADAVVQLDRHVLQDGGVVDRRRWKPLKTREHIAVYRERAAAAFHRQCHSLNDNSHSSTNSSSVRSPESSLGASILSDDGHWPLPRLLGVGTLVGSLEDCMYGIHSPSAAHMMAKAAFSDDEVVDAQVLHELAGPTIAHPFRFLGLKWLVKGHPPAMGAVVLPRDVVYVEHTGLTTRADGSRLGHFLIHSVDLPQCPELRRTQGLVRARVSSCCLLRQRADDPQRVDVFMTGRVAAQGRVLDSLALLSTANGLTYFWKAAVCAQRRKLAWRLQHKRKLPSSAAASAASTSQCPRCAKSPGRAFSSTACCEMCGVRMCSRCRVSRKLVFPGAYGSKRTHAVTVDLCTPCVTRTSQEDPVAIARQEIRAGQYGALTSPREARRPKPRPHTLHPVAKPRRVDFSASAGPPSTNNPRVRPNQTDLAASAGSSATRSAETVTRHSLQALDGLLDGSKSTQNQSQTPDERWDVLTESEDELASHLALPARTRMAVEELDDDSDDELWTQSERTRQTADAIDALPLWQKISALQVMAETTYHFAKKNTEQTLLLSSSGCSSGAAVAPVVP